MTHGLRSEIAATTKPFSNLQPDYSEFRNVSGLPIGAWSIKLLATDFGGCITSYPVGRDM
jgi:hypothetical protein